MLPVLKVAAGRLVLALPMLIVVATATFFVQALVPGDPGSFILGQGTPPAEIRQFDDSLGLNRPLLDQYGSWLARAFRGSFGTSWTTRSPVASALAAALPVTLSLAALALIVIVVAGVLLGTLAALRPGPLDRVIQGAAGFALSVPSFWLGVGLVLLLAIKVSLFPATGYVSLASPVQWLHSLVLPVAALAAAPALSLALQVRSAMLHVLTTDYIRNLTAAGLPRRSVLFRHALRNCMAPVATTVGFQLLGLLAGTVVIEQLFNLPGLGSLLITSVTQHDVPLVQGAVVLFAVFVVGVNLITDVTVAVLNPRARGR